MPEEKQQQNMSKDEQIGFHKGSLATLAKEREEMAKILNIVEQLMQAHIKALKDLGIDLEAQAKNITDKKQLEPKGTDKKIDELI
jgi:biotin operon repressor